VQIITLDGRKLGKIVDVYFNGQTGEIQGYEVTGGIFTDTYCRGAFVPASHIVSIGEEVAFVSLEVADLMEEQIGKAQVAVQTAYKKLQRIAREKILAKALIDDRKAFITGKVAQSTVDAPGGGCLVVEGGVITSTIADAAHYLDVLAELYRSAGEILKENLSDAHS
jgi:sporulation protein YlmC with PRC-barrel domain